VSHKILIDKEKNIWRISVENGREPGSGKRKRIIRHVQGSKKADNLISRIEEQLRNNIYIDNNKHITVAEYFDFWFENCCQGLAPRTIISYKNIAKAYIIPNLGQLELQNIKPVHILQYQNDMLEDGKRKKEGGLHQNTVRKHNVLLNKALRDAVELEFISRNPAESIKPPPYIKPKTEHLKPSEVQSILKVLEGDMMHDIVSVAVKTGMRRGEILGLQWDYVDMDERIISVEQSAYHEKGKGVQIKDKPKNESSRRTIPFSAKTEMVFRRIKTEKAERRLKLGEEFHNLYDTVFDRGDGQPYSLYTCSDKFKRAAEKCGIKANFHMLRHTFATIMRKSGAEPNRIKELLGHSTIQTYQNIYDHSDISEHREIIDNIDHLA